MKRTVAIVTCLALLRATAWAQQEEPAPPPPPPTTTAYPPQQQPPPGYPPPGYPPPGYPPPQQQTYGYPPGYAPRYGMAPGPEQIYRSGRRQRTVGMVLTLVGVGLGALGFALLYDAKYNPHNTDADLFIEDLFGVMFTIAGVGSFIPGVILWANGTAKMDEAMGMGASGMTLAPAPRVAAAPGVTWTIRF
jgi:hypothetical protein